MEAIGEGLKAIGSALSTCAIAYMMTYGIAIICKTFLIYTDKAPIEALKDWFKFRNKSGI